MNPATMLRVPLIIALAALINIAMFIAIEFMVGSERMRLTDVQDFDVANFIRVAEQSREVRSRRDPQAPQKPQQEMQQDLARLSEMSDASGLVGMAVDVPAMNIDVGPAVGSDIAVARERTPLVRVPPEYPMQARAKGLEGWVILRFTVTETGSVADPEVIRSQPPRIFDRAAKRSVLGWKYQPQIRNGKAVRDQVIARITFRMAE